MAGDWNFIDVKAGAAATLTQTQLRYGGKYTAAVVSNGGTIQADGITIQSSASRGAQLAGGYLRNSTLSANVNAGKKSVQHAPMNT